jgi:hypothetical protein
MAMKDLQVSLASAEERSTSDILGRLEAYEKLSGEYRRYASLRANVEEERQSVQLQIYERVKAEYEEKLSALQEDLKEQEALLGDQIQVLLEKRADLDRLCRQDNERLEEINFRTRVGEFTEEECKAERNEIEKRTLSQSQDLARIEEIVRRCTESGLLTDEQPSSPAPDSEEEEEEPQADNDGPQQVSAPSSTTEEQAEEQGPLEAAGQEEDFEIVEEDPSSDDEDSPVVHCPPPLSSGQPHVGRDAKTTQSRRGPTVNPRKYVTGYLVALEGSRQGERFPLISSDITLGNSPGIDIRLGDSGIANFHARILYKERKHCLENLDSMGRTFVNGVQVAAVVELRDGDVIRFGDIKMQVDYASAPTTNPN